jgi:branched-subunit amino acid transport protein
VTWLVIAVVGALTIVFKASGPVLLGHRELPPRAVALVEVLAPAMLAALVVTQTVGGTASSCSTSGSPALPPERSPSICGRR